MFRLKQYFSCSLCESAKNKIASGQMIMIIFLVPGHNGWERIPLGFSVILVNVVCFGPGPIRK